MLHAWIVPTINSTSGHALPTTMTLLMVIRRQARVMRRAGQQAMAPTKLCTVPALEVSDQAVLLTFFL